ncbi:MAG: hypothetical protein H3C48_16510 [Chitinophagaceae bacterium]|nr:hypothetical protein [Chitinophagaceae bacterium]
MNSIFKILMVTAATVVSVTSYAQVRLQTGAPEISFPLYQFNDAKNRLSTGIELTYIGGNEIKVNDIASSVGTGWDLMAAGVIVRVQNGEPDDQKYDKPSSITWDPTDKLVYNPNIQNYYPNGYLYGTTPPQNAVPGNGAFSPLIPNGTFSLYKPNFTDREQDVFLFQFNGRSGKFVIGRDSSVLLIEDSKLKVEFIQTDMSAQNIRTRISEFNIIDENGTKYVFSEREITENVTYGLGYGGFDGGTGGYVGQDITFAAVPIKKVDKWFLKEIVNPFNNKKIIFNYETFSLDYEGPRSASTQNSTQPNSTSQLSRIIQRVKTESKKLKDVILPDGQKVSFIYAASDRVDLDGDKYLERLDISYDAKFKYGYKFNYGYFFKKEIKTINYNFSGSQIRFARLCLLSFAKRINDNILDKEHAFEYHLTDDEYPDTLEYQGVPARFTYRSDYWGYYNAASNVEDENGNPLYSSSTTFTSSKAPHPSAAKIGLIKKIIYPTGGYMEYTYDGNLSVNSGYMAGSFGGTAPGVHVSRTTLHDGVSHSKDIIKNYRYINEAGTASSLWGFEVPVASQTKSLRIYKSSTQLLGATYSKESGTIYAANIGTTAFNLGVFREYKIDCVNRLSSCI